MDYIKVENEWKPQGIRLFNPQDCSEKGVCYKETKQTFITLIHHTSISDIYDTSMEESVHQAIRDEKTGDDESLSMDIEHEEEMIKKMKWFLSDWV